MDRGAWWATVHGVTESNMTEQLTLSFTFTEENGWQVIKLQYDSNSHYIYSVLTLFLYLIPSRI